VRGAGRCSRRCLVPPAGPGRLSAAACLQLEVDASVHYGGLLMAGVVNMLRRIAASGHRSLDRLSLGYLWWTEPQDSVLDGLREALRELNGTLRVLEVRYPQDQELGALEAICNAVEGASAGLEEVRIVDGWAYDGCGLANLAEALGSCAHLRRCVLAGVLPERFDVAAFAERASRARTDLPLSDAKVILEDKEIREHPLWRPV